MRRRAPVVAILAVVGGGCAQPDDRTPEGAVREFAAASARGDAQRVVEMLDRAALDRLSAQAREASDLAGGGVDLRPADLLAVGFEATDMQLAEVRRVDEGGKDDALVRVKDADGRETEVRLRLHEGSWKIVLDL